MMTNNFDCMILTKRLAIAVIEVPNFDYLFQYCNDYPDFIDIEHGSPLYDESASSLESREGPKFVDLSTLPSSHSKSKIPRKADAKPIGKKPFLNKLIKNQRNCESAKASRLKRTQEFNDLEEQVKSVLHLTQEELKIKFNQYYDKAFPADSSHHVKLARGRGRPKQLAKMTPEERAAEQFLIKERNRVAAKRSREKKISNENG